MWEERIVGQLSTTEDAEDTEARVLEDDVLRVFCGGAFVEHGHD